MRAHTAGNALALALFAGALSTTTSACDEVPEPDESKLPAWDDGFDTQDTDVETPTGETDEPVPTEPPDTEFNLEIPESITWSANLRRWDPSTGEVFAEPCAIDLENVTPGAAVEEDCILDFNEGDLYWQGFSIKNHIPAGFCDYLFTQPYMYQAFEIGFGPTQISYTLTADGMIIDEVGTLNGEPQCEFDYSKGGIGPNCCVGQYELTVTDEISGEEEVTPGIWGGTTTFGNCYDGGAYLDVNASRTLEGLPMSPTYYIDREQADIVSTFGSMRTATDANLDDYDTSIALASYIDLADHGGSLPRGLDPLRSNEPFGAFIQPTYDFVCTDNAYEKLGILHLTVREWNTEADFNADGDPNGQEGVNEPQDPFIGFDDLFDWRNFGQAGLDNDYIGYAD